MDKKTENNDYVCLGSCHAHISEEEYNKGLIKCGNDACELHGKPFVRGEKCPKCGTTYPLGDTHHC